MPKKCWQMSPQHQKARAKIREELKKVYPSANDLKNRLIEIQGNDDTIEYDTCYALAQELFKDWYFDDIRQFYYECGYLKEYEKSHPRVVREHYRRVANVILMNIHNNYN